jgi:hypothetical protein
MVKPQPPLGGVVGCSLLAGLAPSDLVAFEALSHVQPPSFIVSLIQLAEKERSDQRYSSS